MPKILTDLFIVPCFDESKVNVTFTVPNGCTAVQWAVEEEGKAVTSGKLIVQAGKKTEFEAAVPDFKPWNIDTPFLYTLKLNLMVDGGPVELVERFGMRKIHATRDAIYVNNHPFYARGFIRGREAHDHPNLLNLPLEEYYAKNIRYAKKYGFNLIRFHSRVPSEECFEMADKLGIFIHIEIRNYFGKYQKERSMMNDAGELINAEQWQEVIFRLRNHPSLMVYCMGNEIRHPGTNPQVASIAKLTKKLDPTRLFIDTCAHGEFDRDYVDIDVQHMSYYYPFGSNYDMFENTYNWFIYGSAKGATLTSESRHHGSAGKITRALAPKRPVLAHEICHYVAMRDVESLSKKFDELGVEQPWWLPELKALIREKGLEADYPEMIKASRFFQFLSWKLGIEAARRSRLLSGFHFLQLSDTERYENSNGLLDCFDDPTGISDQEFQKFNSDTVLLADLPQRTFFEKQKIDIPVLVSHYSPTISGDADLKYRLMNKETGQLIIEGKLDAVNLDKCGTYEIAGVHIQLPESNKSQSLSLELELIAQDCSYVVENSWNLWMYPNRPEDLPVSPCTISLEDVKLSLRYPQLKSTGSLNKPERLLIVNRFSKEVLTHLSKGGDVLMLYRVPVTRDRKVRAPKERRYLPTTWDRFKGVIWDRGTNCGAFVRKNDVLRNFPHEGYADLQFHGLIDDCDKVALDDFPVKLDPIIQGVDKAARDRFDVYTYQLSELEPDRAMRKFGYLFELKVGKGRLLLSGFNFTGLNRSVPETCAMFESLVKYVNSDAFDPVAEISPKALDDYLLEKGADPIRPERKMTQFWQLNEAPLESDAYWKAAEEYIHEKELDKDVIADFTSDKVSD